jgi:hypothetical protein
MAERMPSGFPCDQGTATKVAGAWGDSASAGHITHEQIPDGQDNELVAPCGRLLIAGTPY